MKFAAFNEIGLQKAFGEMRALFKASGYLRGTVSEKPPRSLDQNSLSHTWYAQVSRELGEDTEHAVKCFCKLHYGIPILRADDEEFRELYDAVIKPLPYEKKLKAMDLISVTSEMNTDQLSRFLQCMQDAYRGRVCLEFPDDMARAA